MFLAATILILRAILLPPAPAFVGIELFNLVHVPAIYLPLSSEYGIRKDKFLEIPQIVWGFNNQKIAIARIALLQDC